MGVYIKGMEMPETCFECGLRFCYDVKCRPYQWLSPYGGSKDCPLVEVPEPHGRLIDADALLERWCSEVCKAKPNCKEDCMMYDYLTIDSLSPTIIERSDT